MAHGLCHRTRLEPSDGLNHNIGEAGDGDRAPFWFRETGLGESRHTFVPCLHQGPKLLQPNFFNAGPIEDDMTRNAEPQTRRLRRCRRLRCC